MNQLNFNELLSTLKCNWLRKDWKLKYDFENEWWITIENVSYHRFIRESNQTMIKVEHENGSTMWLTLDDGNYSCSYNLNHNKMLCLIIEKEQ